MGRNICLNGIGLNGWGGGRDNLSMLVEGINAPGPDHSDDLTLLLPLGDATSCIRRSFFQAAKGTMKGQPPSLRKIIEETTGHIINSRNQETLNVLRAIQPDLRVIYARDRNRDIVHTMERHGLEVLLPMISPPGKGFSKPWIGYIYDQQHRVLPQFFSPETIAYRDRTFSQMVTEAKVIVVNSKTVRDESQRFFPHGRCAYVVLPFTPRIPQVWFDQKAIDEVRDRYDVPERYFLISNQFWVHKDHLTAFQALREASDQDVNMKSIHIVCTGSTEDYRFPHHYSRLKKKIDDLGLRSRVHILGHIPKLDQLALLNGSIAVIQPTLYEGGPGGFSVYEAVSYGIPAVISDIPINREITEGDITFFKVSSPSHLATRMIERIYDNTKRSSRESLIDNGILRAQRLHEKLDEAVEIAIEQNRS